MNLISILKWTFKLTKRLSLKSRKLKKRRSRRETGNLTKKRRKDWLSRQNKQSKRRKMRMARKKMETQMVMKTRTMMKESKKSNMKYSMIINKLREHLKRRRETHSKTSLKREMTLSTKAVEY